MKSSSLYTFLPLILLLVIMYMLMIRPQRKREKETTAMRKSVQVGDEIITIGGICAKVVKTKEETLVIQVGADKTKFEVMRWAVSKVTNSPGAPTASRSRVKEEPEEDDFEEEAPKKAMPKRIKKPTPKVDKDETATDKATKEIEK